MKRLLVAAIAFVFAGPVALAAVFTGPSGAVSAPTQTARTEIPADLLPVYMAASLTCRGLPWPVLAAIGWVESRHAGGRADPHSGDVVPPIIGPALDGQNGFATIRDASQPDGWAHALGPMQFLSTTWATWGRLAPDRPPDASPNIQNAWDSIYSAAAYLCGGRRRSTTFTKRCSGTTTRRPTSSRSWPRRPSTASAPGGRSSPPRCTGPVMPSSPRR